MRHQLFTHGLLAPDTRGTVLRFVLWFPIYGFLLYHAWTSSSLLACVASAFALSVIQAQLAFIGHDASHGSAAQGVAKNRLAGLIGMGVSGGLCFEEWQHRHLLHHKHCQIEADDPDMQFGTVLSLTRETIEARTGVGRRVAPYQAYYFWPMTILFTHSLRILALVTALSRLKVFWRDIAAVTIHFGVWLVLPLFISGVDPLRVFVVYMLTASLLGVRLGAVFTVNHIGMPMAADGASHLEHQVVTSRNILNPTWMDWFFGGLNYQIEHHLVPACPRRHLRTARDQLRPAILGAGLPHHQQSWPAAARDLTLHLAKVGAMLDEPAVAPQDQPA